VTITLANAVIDPLRKSAVLRAGSNLTDAQLIGFFVARRDSAAFAALVSRHGPMVMGVCRRILGNHHDAEDAFQATFIVLARKAAGIAPREMVGNWLYGVAYRAAARARSINGRRFARERPLAETDAPARDRQGDLWRDVRLLIDRELNLLPANYRTAVVLCDLEGKSGKDAARQVGWAEGTLSSRLARGRKLLAKRLTRRGVTLSAGALALTLMESRVCASVPEGLAQSARKAATLVSEAPDVSASRVRADLLAKGVVRNLSLARLKAVASALLAISAVGVACAMLPGGSAGEKSPFASPAIAELSQAPASVDAAEPVAKADDEPKKVDHPDMPDGFIVKRGEYRLFAGKLVITVREETGRIRWQIRFSDSSTGTTLGSGVAGVDKGSNWFLFPGSADVIWAYEPDVKRMILIKRQSKNDFVIKHADLPSGWKAVLDLAQLPEKVRKRLPPEMRPENKDDN
jgi:RNA polymerase sigma factor (sigma-70 family)